MKCTPTYTQLNTIAKGDATVLSIYAQINVDVIPRPFPVFAALVFGRGDALSSPGNQGQSLRRKSDERQIQSCPYSDGWSHDIGIKDRGEDWAEGTQSLSDAEVVDLKEDWTKLKRRKPCIRR